MNTVQYESFSTMIRMLEQTLNNERGCVGTGEFDRFLAALANWNASRFYALSDDEIPWMTRATELSLSEMTSIILSYGLNLYEIDRDDFGAILIPARDYFMMQYRTAVYRLQSE